MKLHRILARRIRADHARISRHVAALTRSLDGPPKPGERLALRDTLNLLRAEVCAIEASLDELGRWELAMDMEGIKAELAAEEAEAETARAIREECLAAFEPKSDAVTATTDQPQGDRA